jgi:hypothetical protein
MNPKVIHTIAVTSMVLLAGCAGGLTGSPSASPTGTNDALSGSGASDGGTVSFYLSDEVNDMDDFESLNVTITRVGFERGGDDGGWIERSVDNRTADLTELRGANATLIDEYDLPNGTYDKVFVHVGEVNGTLNNGENVRVQLPSDKLQITKGFTVENGSEVEFVFDITVHRAGNSGKYILRPVIGESGTDVPIESVDGDREDEELTVEFLGNVTRGENATLEVTRNGTPVANASVTLNDRTVGTTDADGRLTVSIPDGEEVEIEVEQGEAEGELEVEFEEGDSEEREDERDESGNADDETDADEPAALTVQFLGNVTPGESATLEVTQDGSPVESATVRVAGETVGTTDADGRLTVSIPDGEEVEIAVEQGDAEGELELQFE